MVVLLTGLFCQWLVLQTVRRVFMEIQIREMYSGSCEHRAWEHRFNNPNATPWAKHTAWRWLQECLITIAGVKSAGKVFYWSCQDFPQLIRWALKMVWPLLCAGTADLSTQWFYPETLWLSKAVTFSVALLFMQRKQHHLACLLMVQSICEAQMHVSVHTQTENNCGM